MPIARIGVPRIFAEDGSNNPSVQKDAFPQASGAVWKAGSLLYTSGTGASTVLNRCATDAVICYGMAAADTYPETNNEPPVSLHGLNHFPFDVRDRIIEMNIGSTTVASIGTSNGVAWTGGGTDTGPALAPGQKYGLIVPTTGNYAGIQFVDVKDTTNTLVEIVGLAPGQSVSDNNPRVLVKIIPEKIQG